MTKITRFFSVAALALSMAFSASAQQVKIGTGGSKGTYHALFADISGACGSKMPMIEVLSDGSVTNLDRLTGKEIGGAFTQTDALFAMAQGRDLGNIATLVAFNRESLHVVVANSSGIKTGGNMIGMGKTDLVFNTAEDLSGFKVAAAGGSLVTAQVLQGQGQIKWEVVPVASNEEALAAVKSGKVQGMLAVGGQPMPFFKEMTAASGIRLIGFKPATIELVKTVYGSENLGYTKMSPTPVRTLYTDALLVVRKVSTPERLAALADLRKCVYENLGAFKDADGAHPAWEQVNADNRGKWAYYELPSAATPKKK